MSTYFSSPESRDCKYTQELRQTIEITKTELFTPKNSNYHKNNQMLTTTIDLRKVTTAIYQVG
jgi:hypothetical protein